MRTLDVNRRLLLFAAHTVAEARRLRNPRVFVPALLRGVGAAVRFAVLLPFRLLAWMAGRLAAVATSAYRNIDFDAFRRSGLLACALAGAVLLIAAEFSTVRTVSVLTVTRDHIKGGPEHFYALAVLGALAVPMAWGAAAGRSRPAMWVLFAIGLAALGVSLGIDLPRLRDTEGLGRLYDVARGSASVGFGRELGGALLLVASATGLLVVTPSARRRARRPRRGEIAVDPSATTPAV